MTPKEQTRVQVLNSLLAEQIVLDQAAELMGVSTRHARRITTAYREEGAAALESWPETPILPKSLFS